MKRIEPLEVKYFDERKGYDEVTLTAVVAEWDDNGYYMELDAKAVLTKDEAKALSNWIQEWLKS